MLRNHTKAIAVQQNSDVRMRPLRTPSFLIQPATTSRTRTSVSEAVSLGKEDLTILDHRDRPARDIVGLEQSLHSTVHEDLQLHRIDQGATDRRS